MRQWIQFFMGEGLPVLIVALSMIGRAFRGTSRKDADLRRNIPRSSPGPASLGNSSQTSTEGRSAPPQRQVPVRAPAAPTAPAGGRAQAVAAKELNRVTVAASAERKRVVAAATTARNRAARNDSLSRPPLTTNLDPGINSSMNTKSPTALTPIADSPWSTTDEAFNKTRKRR